MQKPVTYRNQDTDFYCGPAVVQMILGASGIESSQEELAYELGTIEARGTTIRAIETLLLSRGFTTMRKNDAELSDIQSTLAKGELAIVGYREGVERTPHYALVAKIDQTHLYLFDPWHGENHTLSREEFFQIWNDDEFESYGNRMLLSVTR